MNGWRRWRARLDASVRAQLLTLALAPLLLALAGLLLALAAWTTLAYDRLLQTNVTGTFVAAREAAQLMQKAGFGRIVTLSTVAVPLRLEGEAAYVASKAAVEAMTRVLARELALPYAVLAVVANHAAGLGDSRRAISIPSSLVSPAASSSSATMRMPTMKSGPTAARTASGARNSVAWPPVVATAARMTLAPASPAARVESQTRPPPQS